MHLGKIIIAITIALPFKGIKYSLSIIQFGILKRIQFYRNPGTKDAIYFSKLISMRITYIIKFGLFLIGLSSSLYAAPQDLDTFLDFESITEEGDDFIIGDSPNSVRIIGFTIQFVDDPNFVHSGTRALVLNPNAEEGKIIFERGVNLLQFYAAGIFAIDDLGYSYVEGPPNNTIFEDFEIRIGNPVFADIRNFTIGDPPNTATFTGGIATSTGIQSFNHTSPIGPNQFFVGGSWLVENDKTGTITFNIPAAQVQF